MNAVFLSSLASKLRAAGIHLLLSIAIGICILIVVFFLWYPYPLSRALGVNNVVWLLLVIDVCLGPVLTFFVFEREKKSLKIDLIIIAILQIAGLLWGLHTLNQARPAWLVFVQDRFELVRLADVDEQYYGGDVPSSWIGPRWAAVPLMTVEKKSEMFSKVMKGEPDIGFRPVYFKNISVMWTAINEKSNSLDALHDFGSAGEVKALLSENPDARGWLPLQVGDKSLIVLLGSSLNSLSIVDFGN